MKKFLVFFFLLALLVVFWRALPTYGQTNPNEAAKKYNVTFPVTELGNCADYSSCRTYCDDPIHKDACISFAKKKGFYKEEKIDSRQESLLAAAKAELGCSTPDECRALCHLEANFEKCSTFAKKNNLSTGNESSTHSTEVLQKAKTILGCDSETSCKAVCSQEANHDKCSQFAKEAGLRGGEHRTGPGGCTSEETCRQFCSDPKNAKECGMTSGQNQGQKMGPGGCTSEASCREYCSKHPEECKQMGGVSGTPFQSQQISDSFCKTNPDKCKNSPSGQMSRDEYCRLYPGNCPTQPSGTMSKEDYCKQYPANCAQISQQQSNSPSRDDYCRQYPEKCKNPSQGSSQTTSGNNFGTSGQSPQSFQGPLQGQTDYHPPVTTSQQVRGAATEKNLIQKFFDFLLGR